MLIAAPLVTLALVWNVPDGTVLQAPFLGYDLILVKGDKLSRLFATVFAIMAFAGALFALNQARTVELAAAFVYAGSAIGVAFAGDLITLFVCWELMAIGSTLVVWCGGPGAQGAGLRYAVDPPVGRRAAHGGHRRRGRGNRLDRLRQAGHRAQFRAG